MNKASLFRTLLNWLYFICLISLPISLFAPLFFTSFTKDASFYDQVVSFFLLIPLLTFAEALFFIRGLFFLRKTSRFLLFEKYFSDTIIINTKKAGINFIYAGILNVLVLVLVWFWELSLGEFKVSINNSYWPPLFLMIIGLFFTIQSNALKLAKAFKTENELTV